MDNVDNMEMIKTLSFLHDNVKSITHNILTYTEDNKVYIVDLNDTPIFVEDKEKIIIVGTFVIISKKPLTPYSSSNIKVYNLLTLGESKELMLQSTGTEDILAIGDQFIAIGQLSSSLRSFVDVVIYNIYLQELYKFNLAYTLDREVHYTENAIKVNTKLFCKGKWMNMVLNKQTSKIDVFDSVELNSAKGIELIGTEWCEKDAFNFCSDRVENVKYTLSIMGKLVGKAYQDITKPQELLNTHYFLIHESSDYGLLNKKQNYIRKCVGIIDDSGRELIQPVYDSIKYIGSNTFILTFYNIARVYSLDKGMIFDNIPVSNVWIHQTLPLTVVVTDDSCYVVDSLGRTFNIVDLPKYYECYATSDNDDILKINTGYKSVFTSRKLVPITSIHAISKAMAYNWYRI